MASTVEGMIVRHDGKLGEVGEERGKEKNVKHEQSDRKCPKRPTLFTSHTHKLESAA